MSNPNHKIRNTAITIFVILWTIIFHYESTRHFYLEPLIGKHLPKVKFLFPPAGWIMFYNVGAGSGHTEVYGVKKDTPQLLDPHDIFRTRTIMFDNIHRGILGVVTEPEVSRQFCRFLKYRFPYFDKFMVTAVYYPDPSKNRYERYQKVIYTCGE